MKGYYHAKYYMGESAVTSSYVLDDLLKWDRRYLLQQAREIERLQFNIDTENLGKSLAFSLMYEALLEPKLTHGGDVDSW